MAVEKTIMMTSTQSDNETPSQFRFRFINHDKFE